MAASPRAQALRQYILDLEARARDAEARVLSAEAATAQWRSRYSVANYGWALAEATVHELRTRHSISVEPVVRCRDCAWKGRADPYAKE
jgi:hypothetical protein